MKFKAFILTLLLIFTLLPMTTLAAVPTKSSSKSDASSASTTACNGKFSVNDLAKGTILLPPFLRTADASQNAGFDCIAAGITYYTDFLLVIIGLAAFVYLLFGAFLYVSAFGDEAKVQQAKKTITNAIIGLVLATLSGAFLALLKSILKVT